MKKKPSTNLRSLYEKPKEPQEELIGVLTKCAPIMRPEDAIKLSIGGGFGFPIDGISMIRTADVHNEKDTKTRKGILVVHDYDNVKYRTIYTIKNIGV